MDRNAMLIWFDKSVAIIYTTLQFFDIKYIRNVNECLNDISLEIVFKNIL